MENCEFDNCSAKKEGGGVYAENSTTIESCNFNNCFANYGGGIWARNTTIENCKFEKCSAKWGGGGIYCWWESSKLANNTL